MSTPTQNRVRKLKDAKQAYFTSATPTMPDASYDAEETILKREEPEHPFLLEIGETPASDTSGYDVKLPFPMPSLRKVKPDESSFASFARKYNDAWIRSDKLDGISALWVLPEKKLYLRGDGTIGTDVSRFIPFIHGLQTTPSTDTRTLRIVVRGELIIQKDSATSAGLTTNLRSFVNGFLHRKDLHDTSRKLPPIHFVAYQVILPSITSRIDQFNWLSANGFQVSPFNVVQELNAHEMSAYWNERRQQSQYELDGIVVSTVLVKSQVEFGDKYPDDSVAFKMPLPEQSAQTTVKKVHWTPSRQGVWIPRVEIEPVVIGGARIQFVTGHNARFIDDECIGPGARVIIRRSGDVIPIIDYVGCGCATGEMPPENTWEWNGVHAKLTQNYDSPDVSARKLLHYLRSIGVQHCGESSAMSLVEHGVIGAKELGLWNLESAKNWFGLVAGEKLWKNVRKAEESASEQSIWQGCPHIPPGIGPTRWTSLFQEYPDCKQWMAIATAMTPATEEQTTAKKPSGWNSDLWVAFLKCLTKNAYKWRTEDLARIPLRTLTKKSEELSAPSKGTLVFTGFRDKDLETCLISAGWKIGNTISGNTFAVIVDDSVCDPATHTSSKVRQALEKNVIILTRSTCITRLL
jgi:DNA ligase (NAD+)